MSYVLGKVDKNLISLVEGGLRFCRKRVFVFVGTKHSNQSGGRTRPDVAI